MKALSIIVSGFPAAGKSVLAKRLADSLGLCLHVVGDVLKELAAERGYKVGGVDWWDTPDGFRFLEERRRNHSFDLEVDRRMAEGVKRSNIVVTSYTLPWLTSEGLKIWLKASSEVRAKRLSQRDGISYEEAVAIVKQRDNENINLYHEIYGLQFGQDLAVFDLTVNTDLLGEEEVFTVVLAFIRGVKAG